MTPKLACFVLTIPMVLSGQTQIGGGTCALSSLTGNYAFTLTGRQVSSAAAFQKVYQGNGTANFDGGGNVTFTLNSNTNGVAAQQSYTGTYTLPANCLGTLTATIASGDLANYSVGVYNKGNAFLLSGTDGTYNFTGSGTIQPSSCLISTLSGVYAFNAQGFALISGAVAAVINNAGLLQFDGSGNIVANFSVNAAALPPLAVSASGTYAVTNSCLYSATMMDAAKNAYALNLSITNATGADFDLVGTGPSTMFSGNGHSSFTNPGQAVVNGASFLPNVTPDGAIFSIFGSGLATDISTASTLPLPTMLLSTTVTVNGIPAPLYYVSPGQINAQLPVNIPLGLATIIVKNGSTTSNAAAFPVPLTGPGIFTYSDQGKNRAVIINADGKTTNSTAAPAKVGDVVVAYFTGGGPVMDKGALGTGTAAPGGVSPVSNSNGVTVSGKTAVVDYVGLTPGFVGLYQANFHVPSVAAGDHPVILTIGGQASSSSPAPQIAVSN
ncbi:MAG TPA: hypothetical protein VKG25_08770 [Bryobacteraceae bacterium]|nr:hypothetical protein [Bryobacteraceae bacterium]